MIILITGTTHSGKTLLAQRLLEKYQYPYLSIDHLKMGLIRSNQTSLTVYDDEKLEQERKSLINIRDSFKKIIITRESLPLRRDENGIVIMGIIEFLLDENSLDK